MLRKTLTVALCGGTLAFVAHFTAMTNSSQPPAGRTGAPGETTCASGCHSGGGSSPGGNVALAIQNAPAEYVPGQTYDLTVTVTDGNQTRFGFQLTALTDSDESAAGAFTAGERSATRSANNRFYINHSGADDFNAWSFQWTAPDPAVGDVTFYFAGNAANNNGANSGDHIYNASLTLPGPIDDDPDPDPDPVIASLPSIAEAGARLYPNPAADRLFIDQAASMTASVTDLTGRVLDLPQVADGETLRIDLTSLPIGVYVLRLHDGKRTYASRFLRR